MDNNQQRSVKPDWKVSIIPQNAGNATDPTIASTEELEKVISNPGSLKAPEPINTAEAVIPAPRYNANVQYTPELVLYTAQDEELMKRIRIAVQNGWKGYHRFANDATTIGLEAEAVIQGMKKQRMDVSQLLLDEDFNRHAWK